VVRARGRGRARGGAGRGVGSTRHAKSEAAEVPEVMGVPLTADFAAVGMVYFAQGALGLAGLAKQFFLKDTLHLPPAEASLLLSATYWPWIVKPVWGFIADSFPVFGSRRRAYLLAAGLLSCAGWLALGSGFSGDSKEAAVLLMMLGNFGIAFSDVVVDGLVVEKARSDDSLMGSLQSYSWSCRALGAICSAYFSGSLIESWGVSPVFQLTGMLPLVVALAALLIQEEAAPPSLPAASRGPAGVLEDSQKQLSQLWEVFRSPQVLLPVVFLFLWQSTPSAGSAMFYFYTNELHLRPEFLGRAQLAGAVATLAGTVLYNRMFANVPVRDYLLRVNLAAVALGLLPLLLVTHASRALGVPDEAFILGDDVVQTVAGELAHMPILVLAARLCPPGVEATLFALLMSLLNLGSFAASFLSSALTDVLHVTEADFTNLAPLLILCNLSGLLPLALLNFVPEAGAAEEEEKRGEVVTSS